MKTSYRNTISFYSSQSGAALVVGLLLLLVLTLLAVSGMNSAGLELTMAGNTQIQEKAFQMAEQGIQIAVVKPSNFDTSQIKTLNSQSPACGGSALASTDSNSCEQTTVTITPINPEGTAAVTSPGNSLNKFRDYPFQVQSVATSAQNATTTNTQITSILSQSGS